MRIQLSDHFTYKRLLRFVMPSIFMMICMSLYSIVDGVFVSNFVGKTAFAAVNLIMPVAMGISTVGFMIGTGGSAIVSKTLGEGKKEDANRYFSMMIYVAVAFCVVLSILGFVFMPQLSNLLGAEGELLENCIGYGRVLSIALTPFVLQSIFQSFFVTAEKPGLSLKMSIISGITNIILDYVFIAVFKWGVVGAAMATGIGQVIGGVVPLIYFARDNDSLLRIVKTKIEWKIILKTCLNGSSEMVSNLSASIVNILYNFQLIRLAGENGVAAYGVIMYTNFTFTGIYFGYSMGSAPIVGYHYGAANYSELKNLFKKSIALMIISGVVLTLAAEISAVPLVTIFAGYDAELFVMTCRGFMLYSLSFVIMGYNIWSSAFFTALNNGAVSAIISFVRTFILQVAAVMILPAVWGLDGIWLSVVAAELVSLTVTVGFIVGKRKMYHYA